MSERARAQVASSFAIAGDENGLTSSGIRAELPRLRALAARGQRRRDSYESVGENAEVQEGSRSIMFRKEAGSGQVAAEARCGHRCDCNFAQFLPARRHWTTYELATLRGNRRTWRRDVATADGPAEHCYGSYESNGRSEAR